MKQFNLKFKDRQTGKTYKIIDKLWKHIRKGDNPILFVINGQLVKDTIQRINTCSMGNHIEDKVFAYWEWDDKISVSNKVILLDDFDFSTETKRIIKYAKKNNIKIIGYSTRLEN